MTDEGVWRYRPHTGKLSVFHQYYSTKVSFGLYASADKF